MDASCKYFELGSYHRTCHTLDFFRAGEVGPHHSELGTLRKAVRTHWRLAYGDSPVWRIQPNNTNNNHTMTLCCDEGFHESKSARGVPRKQHSSTFVYQSIINETKILNYIFAKVYASSLKWSSRCASILTEKTTNVYTALAYCENFFFELRVIMGY